jgi:LmbE family N-acetylglucosaminyl deacetylase
LSKFVFFQAHPDDLELNCGHLIHYLASRGNDVCICSITKGEFGLASSPMDTSSGDKYDRFKGDVLANVRTRELYAAQAIHGIHPDHITFLGYVDGLVPFNREFVDRVAAYLIAEHPDVVFASEPIYTWYYHHDHTYHGRAVFHAIYHGMLGYTPKLYFYQSLTPNFFFGFGKADKELTNQLIACHKTQAWLLNSMGRIHLPLAIIHGLVSRSGWHLAEGYRQVFFKAANLGKNKPSRKTAIFSHFFDSLPFYKAKYPDSVLADLKAKDKI